MHQSPKPYLTNRLSSSFGNSGSLQELGNDQNPNPVTATQTPTPNTERTPPNPEPKSSHTNFQDLSVAIDNEAESRLHAFLMNLNSLNLNSGNKNELSEDVPQNLENIGENAEGGKIGVFNTLLYKQMLDVYIETFPYIILPTIDSTHCIIS